METDSGTGLHAKTLEWDVLGWRVAKEYRDVLPSNRDNWYIRNTRYSGDGSMLVAICTDSVVRVVSTESTDVIATISYGGIPSWAEFSAGGTRVVVAGDNGLQVWELRSESSVAGENVIADRVKNFAISPSPVMGPVYVSFEVDCPTSVGVGVYDAAGKLAWFSNEKWVPQGNNRLEIPVAGLSSGIYFVSLRGLEGVGDTTFRVIISR
jgi:WD40 repeat protein